MKIKLAPQYGQATIVLALLLPGCTSTTPLPQEPPPHNTPPLATAPIATPAPPPIRAQPSADTFTDSPLYQVVEVTDGDTIKVSVNGAVERVRLLAIDTPESVHPSEPAECFGREASRHLATLLGGQQVHLQSDSAGDQTDRYGRLLRYVYLPDGTNVNAVMVRDGFAHAYTRYPVSQDAQMERLESEARQANRGLWNAC